jgi:predicted RNase H-like nuclease
MVAKKPPYKNIAGVTPFPGGWLVLPARLAGITVAAEEAFVLPKLFEVLDFRPTFEAAAINVPMGLFDTPSGQYRPCDSEARDYVGWPRVVGISGTPSREAIRASNGEARGLEPWMTKHDLRRLRWLREAEKELQPYHSRSFFSANPDVSFTAMNSDVPLATSPYHEDGRIERLELIRERLPGVDDVVTRIPPDGAAPVHLLQAAALLFTARRASGRAISRMPIDPTWDEAGLRIELVR